MHIFLILFLVFYTSQYVNPQRKKRQRSIKDIYIKKGVQAGVTVVLKVTYKESKHFYFILGRQLVDG